MLVPLPNLTIVLSGYGASTEVCDAVSRTQNLANRLDTGSAAGNAAVTVLRGNGVPSQAKPIRVARKGVQERVEGALTSA